MTDTIYTVSRVFSKNVIKDLFVTGKNDTYQYVVEKIIESPLKKTHREIFCHLYDYLNHNYRNEYFYINTLMNKLIAGIHNVNTTTAISQLRISNHIADFVVLNGEGKIYEIKSDIDNLDRLNGQLCDYYKSFSKVSVLASEDNYLNLEKQLLKLGKMGDSVGIYVLSDKNVIFSRNKAKEPKEYNDALDSYSIFTMLRKREYENILLNCYGFLPKVAPAFYFKECFKQFESIPILQAQKYAFNELKKRNTIEKEEFDSIPMELKSVIYFNKDLRNLDSEYFFKQRYGG